MVSIRTFLFIVVLFSNVSSELVAMDFLANFVGGAMEVGRDFLGALDRFFEEDEEELMRARPVSTVGALGVVCYSEPVAVIQEPRVYKKKVVFGITDTHEEISLVLTGLYTGDVFKVFFDTEPTRERQIKIQGIAVPGAKASGEYEREVGGKIRLYVGRCIKRASSVRAVGITPIEGVPYCYTAKILFDEKDLAQHLVALGFAKLDPEGTCVWGVDELAVIAQKLNDLSMLEIS